MPFTSKKESEKTNAQINLPTPQPKKPELKVVGEGCNESGERYFKVEVSDSNVDIPPIAVADIVRDNSVLFAALTNAGLNCFSPASKKAVLDKLETFGSARPSFQVVTRLGWHGTAFALPSEIVGKSSIRLEPSFEAVDPAMLAKYSEKGSLQEWQDNIAKYCRGNSRLMFAVSAALTGPILAFTNGPQAGGFQFYGDAECGKTTAVLCAGSVWGCHKGERAAKGFAESWNTTPNKVEATASTHNDAVLVLDENNTITGDDKKRASVVVEVVFRLAEQVERERLTQTSARSWRVYFLSTSNMSFSKLGELAGKRLDAAELSRMADIPMPKSDYGIFEDLRSFQSGAEFSDTLKAACQNYYGTPARAFIKKVARGLHDGEMKMVRFLERRRAQYRSALEEAAKDLPVRRLSRNAGRFATVYAAGCLAIKYDILPWKRHALLNAVLACHVDHLEAMTHRSAEGSDFESCLKKLADFIRNNHGQFLLLSKRRLRYGRDKIDKVVGFREKKGDRKLYYLTEAKLKQALGDSGGLSQLKAQLAARGLLMKKSQKFVVQAKVFRGGEGSQNYAWLHAIDAKILDECP